MAQLTRQLKKLDATLADGELFTRDPAHGAEVARTRANVVVALAKAEEEWLAASAALETA
jgi:ATP-binding cassette subfamily F protein 3